jgi:RNA polymerase sigma factor (sigma-70 family)
MKRILPPHRSAAANTEPAAGFHPRSWRPASEAQQRLIQDNLGFVIKVACDYRHLGVPIEDLIGEGCLGLMEAAARYDPLRGTRFVTYAAAWVRKAILRALSEGSRAIRIPPYQLDRIKHYQRAEAILSTQLGRRPERDEVSRRLAQPGAAVDALLRSRIFEIPLEEGDGKGRGDSVLGSVADPDAPNPESEMLRDESRWMVEQALSTLNERERRVIVRRYGLDGGVRASLREVAEGLNVSRERVRQIEERAKQKIRRLVEKKLLCRRGSRATMRRVNSDARPRALPRERREREVKPGG